MKVVFVKLILVGISLMLISVIFTGQSSAEIDPENIVGLWLLDENSGNTVKDTSANKKGGDGKFVQKPKWAKGQFGSGLEFDAGPYVEIPFSKTNDFEGWEKITLAGWYKTNQLNSENWMFRDGQAMMGQTANPNEWSMALRIGGDWANLEGVGGTKFPPKKGTWMHVTGVYDGKEAKLFVDGQFDRKLAWKGGLEAKPNPIMFGSRGGGQLYNGFLDEMAIFDVPLEEGDIKGIFTKGFENLLAVSPEGRLTTTWAKIKRGK